MDDHQQKGKGGHTSQPMRLERFPCRDATQLLAASLQKSGNFELQLSLRSAFRKLPFAESANWKLNLAANSKLLTTELHRTHRVLPTSGSLGVGSLTTQRPTTRLAYIGGLHTRLAYLDSGLLSDYGGLLKIFSDYRFPWELFIFYQAKEVFLTSSSRRARES